MASRHQRSAAPRNQDDAQALVCGLCEELLAGRHDSRAEADQAAEDHAEAVHPEESPIVVVPVSAVHVDEAAEASLVAFAAQAQERIDLGQQPSTLIEAGEAVLRG